MEMEIADHNGKEDNVTHEDSAQTYTSIPAEVDPGDPSTKKTKKGKKRKVEGLVLPSQDLVTLLPLDRNDVLMEPPPLVYKPQQMSAVDKASTVYLEADNMSVVSRKGYRMARATHGCHEGCFFFEITINYLGETGHARLGWATRSAELQAPVGYDDHSFAYRDLDGSKVHQSYREDYGQPYGVGDVIGCLLHLGQGGRPLQKKHADVVAFKGKAYVKEETDPESLPRVLEGSFVGFTKNGEFQGIAFRNLKEGVYYPAISLYTRQSQEMPACVTINFGPDFAYPIPEVEGCPLPTPASVLAGSPDNPIAETVPEGREEKRTQTEDTEHTGVNGVLLLPEPAPNVMETCAA